MVTLESQPLYFEQGIEPTFATPSGKIELYSTRLAEHKFDPIPRYKAHAEPPPGYYRLLYGRSPVHTFARTTNNPVLTQLQSENEVWINAQVARDLGVKHGEYVLLINQDGVESQKIKAKVTQRIRSDCVYMVHGFGHTDKRLTIGYNKGADDQRLITRYELDPIMGGSGMRVNFVTIRKEAA
ncbi:molybdopterin dinucleotide binding domain-containing protein [candidate division CSSED10-310 bacterium]|uniref:Molybdopterin dinucleotide binding domain-containing protein n=1 Tax=candidate division CSSED10-310 bacterium TaxID=2855610 RepID=A0ABV6Z3Y8_UNCC1